MIFERVIYMPFVNGIKPNERGRGMSYTIIGGDTETIDGEPLTFQFYSEDMDINEILWVKPETATKRLCRFLDSLPAFNTYVIYVLNLAFDLVEFLYDKKELLIDDEISFEAYNWKFSGVFGGTTFMRMTHKKTKNKTVYIIDIGNFYKGSLAKLSNLFCPDFPKLEPPKHLGKKRFNERNKKFIKYAMQDAVICYKIGKVIDGLHDYFEIRQSFSIAHFAALTFRHHFLKTEIPFPSVAIRNAALLSYHGGKNNVTVPNMTRVKNVYSIDIVSAYPFAMSIFPSFSRLDAYKALKAGPGVSKFPPLGIYNVIGHVKECPYPIIYDHAFHPVQGKVNKIWITGWELNEAIRAREINIDYVYGYYYDYTMDNEESPFADYVDYFFLRKKTAKDPVRRNFFKIVLNSLYGKFIQAHKTSRAFFEYDIDNDELIDKKIIKTGSMFNPFIASLITGHTRAYIHRLEHDYEALHTSTDGIFSTKKPVKTSSNLGGIEIDCFGDLHLMRNKLYFILDKKSRKPLKYALHGFRGNIDLLMSMWENGVREYEFIHVNKLRESIRRGIQVNLFETRKGVINV